MMPAQLAFLPLLERGVIAVTGNDATNLLDNLLTNNLDGLTVGQARFAALLTPQGKIAYECFALRTTDGFLLDTPRASIPDFIKRLTLYRLRAKITLKDESDAIIVGVSSMASGRDPLRFPDPRDASLGYRVLSREPTQRVLHDEESALAYRRQRISSGVAESGIDYTIGDTFPHEANFDRHNGVSFEKGCFVGQEVVARMQNKTVVRRRVVRVSGASALTEGAVILHGAGEIGRIGTVDDRNALALLRLDRALEARDKSEALLSNGVAVTVEQQALDAYRNSIANKPVIDL